MSNHWYLQNPLTHADRRLSKHASAWARGFSCEKLKPLIICRGPVRKEAMDIFEEMGIQGYGILLSEKDSITYANALAPELRTLTNPDRVHRVPDYTGATKEERRERVAQIIMIAHKHGYDSVFAGYGFMSEDEEMVRSMEQAGLIFIGPCSRTQGAAGLKDQAKRTALEVGVSVTPGVDDATSRALLRVAPDREALLALAGQHDLTLPSELPAELGDLVSLVLESSYQRGVDLFSIEELSRALSEAIREIFLATPNNRVRLKAIAGGGGKGQRILRAPSSFEVDGALEGGARVEAQVERALEPIPSLVREVLAEVKCDGVGDNKNVIAELNIETTRHQEIQVVGNGVWCVTLGGRDCSLQMHEQKLLEVSVTHEELSAQLASLDAQLRSAEVERTPALRDSLRAKRETISDDLKTLERMEEEASRFGQAVGLDSVSTFECIVDGARHYFMEMNTRIQVEHRVTELCYALTFTRPDDATGQDSFTVTSLIELMVLLATHKSSLPKPERTPRLGAAVEARLNATNDALKPHAGGVITDWSDPVEGEVRDDQGISLRNPDTGVFMRYHLAGAYDSNVALLLTTGDARRETYEGLREVLRVMKLKGDHLATNLNFHYGLVSWLLGNEADVRPTTRFVVPYLTALGELKAEANLVDLDVLTRELRAHTERVARAQSSALEDTARARYVKATLTALDLKTTLVRRPIELLLSEPHLLGGWVSLHQRDFECETQPTGELTVRWLKNPLRVLSDLYQYLNMEHKKGRPALWQIWSHDHDLLSQGEAFYQRLEAYGLSSDLGGWLASKEALEASQSVVPTGLSDQVWAEVCSAHKAHQVGLELLSVLPYLAQRSGFFDLKVEPDLSVHIPDRLTVVEHQKEMERVLVPPPEAKSDEIVALSGGMFYPREAPGHPTFVDVGDHFEAGQPLYIVEVMKMFNKVFAPFSGTITERLIDGDGVIIKKGQPLFKVKPDLELKPRDLEAERLARLEYAREISASLLRAEGDA
jgi:acetyl/propionyl-CoA carboxylase alpha subunit